MRFEEKEQGVGGSRVKGKKSPRPPFPKGGKFYVLN